MLIVEADDFSDTYNRLDYFNKLKSLNPAFKITVYAIPGKCSLKLLESIPPWIQLAVHGWYHTPKPECSVWDRQKMLNLLSCPLVYKYFAKGFKAPWYIMSNDCYDVLKEEGYWISDIQTNIQRIPQGVNYYIHSLNIFEKLKDFNSLYFHLESHNPDSIEKIFDNIGRYVKDEKEFKFVSEIVQA